MSEQTAPVAFLSYSWSSDEYVDRVTQLAEQLMSHGVDVVFDQWDLKQGQDLHSFMEQSVNRVDVTHVLILCDPTYAQKANERQGGVGKETLIVSPTVYESVTQKRVIPVIMERDSGNRVVVPTYLNGRRYIDLSDATTQLSAYEELLRALYERPARARPRLGPPPPFIADDDYVPLKTTAALGLFRNALLSAKPYAHGLLADVLDRFVEAYKEQEFTTLPSTDVELEEAVVESIEAFSEYRDEFITLSRLLGRYTRDAQFFERVHKFFEGTADIRYQRRATRWREEVETENLAFISWELFLHCVTALIAEFNFDGLDRLLRPFHVRSWQSSAGTLRNLDVLEPGFSVLSNRNARRQLNKLDLAASMLYERAPSASVAFEGIMEADLVLWYRTATSEPAGHWYPRSLVYLGHIQRLPLFERGRDPLFFTQLAPVLGVTSREDFKSKFERIHDDAFFRIGRSLAGRGNYARQLGIEN